MKQKKDKPQYSELQKRIIRGEIPEEQIKGTAVRYLLSTAIARGDEEIVRMASELMDKCKERAHERRRERIREYTKKEYYGETDWKTPKNLTYTEHELIIIRDETPIEKVQTGALIRIHKKAQARGETELSERMLDLIMDRRMETRNNRLEILERQQMYPNEKDVNFKGRNYLTRWERNVVFSNVPPGDCPLDHMKHIVAVCEAGDDEEMKRLARLVLQYKEHPETLYVTQDPEEAFRIYEQLVGRRLKRPDSWIKE